MLKKLLLGVAALVVVGSVAYAEDTASNGQQNDVQMAQADDNNDAPPPAPGNSGPQANNNGNGGGWWEWHHRWHGQGGGDHGGQGGGDRWGMGQGGPGHGGPGGPGMHGPGGPGMMMGMMGPHNGFRIQLGKGISVGVMCGKEAIKDCVADAQPLIDAAKAAAQAQGSAAPAK